MQQCEQGRSVVSRSGCCNEYGYYDWMYVSLEMMGNPRLLEIMAIKRAGLITCCCLRLCTNLCVRLRCGIRVLLIMRL